MGVVYEARHVDIERTVALKIIRPNVGRDPAALELFRREARTASQIGSKHIIEIFDFAELDDGRLLFAMELVDGKPLSSLVRAGTVSPARAIAILRQVCKGLADAHMAGVLHRDIKPENIMLTEKRGRKDFVKLLDFGVSTMMGDVSSADDVLGTPYYMPPEVVGGSEVDERSDIYALGCTAYEMLVGRPPFVAETVRDIVRAHLSKEPVPIREAKGGEETPPELERVVMRCLAKNPSDRYRDMADLEAALCEAQIEAGLHTPWDDLTIPEVDPERRAHILRDMPDMITDVAMAIEQPHQRRGAFALIVATIVLVLGIGIGVLLSSDSEQRDPQAERLEHLSGQVLAAAAKNLYVYPRADARREPTAYSLILEIEALKGDIAPLAASRAERLRTELADTLVHLGDEFWEQDGGLKFAIDYYAQAVLLDPSQERAGERASLTPGQLALLQHKAEMQEFTADELVAVEPLVVMAQEDERERAKRLAQLRKQARADSKTFAKKARTALHSGDEGEARHLFNRAIAKNGRNAEALVQLSELYVNRGEFERAADLLQRAVSTAPKNANYRVRLGDAYFRIPRYRDARDQYARAVELGDESASYWVQRTEAKLTK
jgi:tetratricopeptide (TPR) repeat protein/tRNA A-37 threonylcarbamoyl transferase component Bud32